MATKREKGVTLNSRGVYEIRLAGKYRGCRKSLKEANALSLEIQNGLAIKYLKPAKKQSTVTGRKNRASSPKSKKITEDTKQVDCTNLIPTPKPASVEMVKRVEVMPEKKESFWSRLKKAIFKN